MLVGLQFCVAEEDVPAGAGGAPHGGEAAGGPGEPDCPGQQGELWCNTPNTTRLAGHVCCAVACSSQLGLGSSGVANKPYYTQRSLYR